jgi:hypothetical protein
MSQSIEPDEIDDLPSYPGPSSSAPLNPSQAESQVFGRMNNIAGEVAADRRYTGGDTLDEPVSATIVCAYVIIVDCSCEMRVL